MSEHITHTPTVKRLERSSDDKWIAGVCGGLGRYFDLNPAVFRLGLVVLTLLGGAGILVYLAAVLVVPAEGKQSIAADVLAERRDRPWPLVALGLAIVAIAVLLSRASTWPTIGAGWIVILIAGLAVLWASRRERRGHRILIAFTAFAVALVVLLVAAVIAAFSWFNVSLGDGTGDRVYAPVTASAVQPSYELGIGNLRIDLSRVPLTTPMHVKARVGIGELKVIVPTTASVVVDAHAKVGDLYVLNRHDDGRNATVHAGGGNILYLDARVGAGRVDVVRAG
ncbi:MAG TPA: PspC domain-containing protein [Gaiellaceae bacterium]|jgi:prepilin-type processing-associated H-X9-DG protein|nr:PspC domain-containing protein [Gaiellaceae bacterium]